MYVDLANQCFILVTVISCVGSFNLQLIIESQKNIWFFVPFFPLFLLFFISSLAETNRHPFDLPEAEAELVSGYNVESKFYSFVRNIDDYGYFFI